MKEILNEAGEEELAKAWERAQGVHTQVQELRSLLVQIQSRQQQDQPLDSMSSGSKIYRLNKTSRWASL